MLAHLFPKKVSNHKITIANVRPFLRVRNMVPGLKSVGSGRVSIPLDKFKKTTAFQIKLNAKIFQRVSYYLHCEFLIDSELLDITRYIERHVAYELSSLERQVSHELSSLHIATLGFPMLVVHPVLKNLQYRR